MKLGKVKYSHVEEDVIMVGGYWYWYSTIQHRGKKVHVSSPMLCVTKKMAKKEWKKFKRIMKGVNRD